MNDMVPKAVAEQHFIGKCEAEGKAARYKIALEESIPKELIKAMAMEIGKAAVAHVEVMYPAAIKSTPSTFKLSLRNHIYNDIMAMAEYNTEAEIKEKLVRDAKFLKQWVGMYRKIRRKKAERHSPQDEGVK